MSQSIFDELVRVAGAEHVEKNVPMSGLTTFRIGGSADYLVRPDSAEKTAQLVKFCTEQSVPYLIMGNGSNMLVGDRGYRGVVIRIGESFSRIDIEGEMLCAQAGALLSDISEAAVRASLTGFEFACGIPGTLGGALMMNAGAYDGEMKQVVEWVKAADREGNIIYMPKEELGFGYRTSAFAGRGLVALEAGIRLERGDRNRIQEKVDDLTQRRESKQPLEYGSAGSTFKRPKGHFAGQLIQEAGLRGFRIGDAMVSEKHCGFVINVGHASAADVTAVMDEVVRRVRESSGVTLEPEVKRIGEFS